LSAFRRNSCSSARDLRAVASRPSGALCPRQGFTDFDPGVELTGKLRRNFYGSLTVFDANSPDSGRRLPAFVVEAVANLGVGADHDRMRFRIEHLDPIKLGMYKEFIFELCEKRHYFFTPCRAALTHFILTNMP